MAHKMIVDTCYTNYSYSDTQSTPTAEKKKFFSLKKEKKRKKGKKKVKKK